MSTEQILIWFQGFACGMAAGVVITLIGVVISQQREINWTKKEIEKYPKSFRDRVLQDISD
jgi:hypothetical protein